MATIASLRKVEFRKVRPGLACVLAVVGFVGLDALLFRSGLYAAILEPDSSTGEFEQILRRERMAQSRYGENLVVTMGDSRFAYYPRESNKLAPQTGFYYRHAGVAGTDIRAWYYMLRDLDPTRRRYRAIVVGVDDYDDEDGAYDIVNDLTTLHFVIARLRMGDVIEFARSLDNTRARWEALRGGVFEGLVYQNDIRAFLSNPVKRIKYVRLCRRGFEEWTYDFVDDQRNVVGLEIDWKSFTAKIPPGNPDLQFQLEQFVLYRPKPQTGKRAGFRRQWFGRLIDAYRGSPTKIIFVRLPRGPIPRPNWLVRKLSSSIREFASRPNVFLLDEHTFDSLETPALFKDAFHLNDDGCTRFSVKLAREVSRLLRQ